MPQTPNVPTSLEVMAQIDSALTESGLDQPGIEREPVPLFDTLLDEWLVCQGLEPGILLRNKWTFVVDDLLRSMSVCEVRESLRMIVEETVQLCRAHGSLTMWKQRELDNKVRFMNQCLKEGDLQQRMTYRP
ncbi:MAG: hypothetical protein MK185_12130 [Saccharospirillaceae bacterium]|nr:hypothetical protein [Saccharospirillaceae bacterium]